MQNELSGLDHTTANFRATPPKVLPLFFQGMGVFSPEQNPSTQLWMAARYLESVMVLLATVMHRRLCESPRLLYGFLGLQALLTILALLLVFQWRVLPLCYDEILGLTEFKKACRTFFEQRRFLSQSGTCYFLYALSAFWLLNLTFIYLFIACMTNTMVASLPVARRWLTQESPICPSIRSVSMLCVRSGW